MDQFSARLKHYRIGILGLCLILLSASFVIAGPANVPPASYSLVFYGLLGPFVLLAILFRSFVRAAAPVFSIIASLALVHIASALVGFSRESVNALFFLTLMATGGTAVRASAAIMTNVAKFGRCDVEKLPLKEIVRYGLAGFLAGVVVLGSIFSLADRPIEELVLMGLIGLAAPFFGFGLFFFLILDGRAAGEEAIAHHNRLLRHAGAFEPVGGAALVGREGRGLLLFLVPLLVLMVAVYTGADVFQGKAVNMLLLIGGLTGVALFAGRTVRSALVMGLSISVFAALLGFAIGAWDLPRSEGPDVFAALNAAVAIMLPPSIYLYQLCDYHLMKRDAMRTVLATAAVRGVAIFMLTAALFILGALPWILLGGQDASLFAVFFSTFLALGALFVPLLGLSLFSVVEMLFPRRSLIKWTV